MSDYTEFHPRWYRRRVSTYWWLKQRSHLAFILRELSAIFVAWFVVYLLLLLRAVGQGAESYQEFLSWSGSTGILLLNVVSLLFVVLHAITWFNLSAQAMVVHFRGERVPGAQITASNYVGWALVSAFLAWLVLGG